MLDLKWPIREADIHRHDGDVRFVMNGHARRWSKAPPVAGSTFYLGVHPGCGSVKTPSPINYAVDFSKVPVGYACGSKRRLCSGQARLLGAPQGPKPSEGL